MYFAHGADTKQHAFRPLKTGNTLWRDNSTLCNDTRACLKISTMEELFFEKSLDNISKRYILIGYIQNIYQNNLTVIA